MLGRGRLSLRVTQQVPTGCTLTQGRVWARPRNPAHGCLLSLHPYLAQLSDHPSWDAHLTPLPGRRVPSLLP